jgi:membrane protein implicated in regulation of membrane protease activity
MELLGSYKLFWFALGLAFLVMEVLTPGVVFVFFGLAAWAVLLILLVIPLPPVLQWIVFTAISVVALLTLRKHVAKLFAKKRQAGRDDSLQDPMVAGVYVGRGVVVVGDIGHDRPGRVGLNGTNWQAWSRAPISKGAMARIVEVRDLSFLVEPLS